MTSIQPLVVGLGELVWDRLPGACLPGGAPANFVHHAKQLGARGAVVTAVGDDVDGLELLRWLARMAIETDAVQTNAQPSGSVSVALGDNGEPRYVIREDVAWDAIEWTDTLASLAVRADCVCVGSLAQRSPVSRATIRRFLGSTRGECLRIFDINLREPYGDPEVVAQTIPLINVLKLNDDEWRILAPHLRLGEDPIAGCKQLIDRSPIELVALTRGEQGSVLITADDVHELPAEPVHVRDTVGAGDAFAASVALGLLRGLPLPTIQAAASAISAYVCTQSGATPALPADLCAPLTPPTATVHLATPHFGRRRAAGSRGAVAAAE